MTCLRNSAQLSATLVGLVFALACGDGDENPQVLPGDPSFLRDAALNVANISRHGSIRSHNVGLNCMNCHQSHGPGKGLFSVAGTLRNADGQPHPNGTVYLMRGNPAEVSPDAALDALLTVEADAFGNFYSTESLPLPEEPLFVAIERQGGGGRNFMPWPTVTAACNVCHVGSNPAAVKD